MSKITNIVFILVLFFFLYTPTKQAVHMFQQNRYQMKRYVVWLLQECEYKKKSILITFFCLMGTYGLYFVSYHDLPLHLLMLLLMIYSYVFYKIEDMKEYRKPLVFTHRVQRMFVVCYLLYVVLIFILWYVCSSNIWIALIPFLYYFPWLFIIVLAYIMKPIEEYIRRYFMRDAKKILQRRNDLMIIGITGSYGKTSIKNIIQTLLSDSFYTLATPHSYNNMMGITLSIRNSLQNLHEVFVCEMGADHVHEIEHLMDFVNPRFGLVSAVGPQHLSTFKSMENILHEKMQMIEKLPIDGIGFINIDNEYIRNYRIKNPCMIMTYGTREECDFRASHIRYSKEGSRFKITHEDKQYEFTTRLLGEHNVLNITGSIAVARCMDINWDVIANMVASLEYIEHRLQIRENGRYTIIDNAYNSNPEGAHYALEVMKQIAGRRIIVTPGFLDLGENEKYAHRVFGNEIADAMDEVILVGKEQSKDIVMGLREKHYPLSKIHVVQNIHEAFHLLETLADDGTTVLLENDLPDAFNH